MSAMNRCRDATVDLINAADASLTASIECAIVGRTGTSDGAHY